MLSRFEYIQQTLNDQEDIQDSDPMLNFKSAEELYKDMSRNYQLSGRLGLDYAKLFLNQGGGYDLDTLKQALEKIKNDRELGILTAYNEDKISTNDLFKYKKRLDHVIQQAKDSKSANTQEGEDEQQTDDQE